MRARLRRARAHPAAPPLGALAAGAAAAAYLYRTDPHRPGQWLLYCPFRWLTGLDCPTCGATRMVYDLMHGDLAAAFHDNAALLLLGVPAGLWLGWRWLREGLRGRRYRPSPRRATLVTALTLTVLWGIGRNVVG
ncbi:DUF2752 domain-containing protein [Streptomyces zingiberis]|uniref:DUF2752 domain-containing protein n=1 Tax=Streptomyces zingiberis TaxID=2053010 RepID=A0ABX1BUK8_9ACTN|nr:DUF2752 domain-containing protein [Streptomyces zingiberis]NJP99051.1 DUF2752 domain-containing protein [Streptomyces zingiberis]